MTELQGYKLNEVSKPTTFTPNTMLVVCKGPTFAEIRIDRTQGIASIAVVEWLPDGPQGGEVHWTPEAETPSLLSHLDQIGFKNICD